MYAAEALVSLDRISEAIEFLSTDKVNTISLERDENGKNSPVSGNFVLLVSQCINCSVARCQ